MTEIPGVNRFPPDDLDAPVCPHSGLPLVLTELVTGEEVYMCEVCDCFGYTTLDLVRDGG